LPDQCEIASYASAWHCVCGLSALQRRECRYSTLAFTTHAPGHRFSPVAQAALSFVIQRLKNDNSALSACMHEVSSLELGESINLNPFSFEFDSTVVRLLFNNCATTIRRPMLRPCGDTEIRLLHCAL